jgi:hypothetical protein
LAPDVDVEYALAADVVLLASGPSMESHIASRSVEEKDGWSAGRLGTLGRAGAHLISIVDPCAAMMMRREGGLGVEGKASGNGRRAGGSIRWGGRSGAVGKCKCGRAF